MKISDNEPIELMLLEDDIYREGEFFINFKPVFNQTTISYSNKKLR
jgi:adenine specific DNA methylase Mod